jgi:hypothetical protein
MADRLYGLPGDDRLYDSVAAVYECCIEDIDPTRGPWKIEEFTVHSARYHLPTVDLLIGRILEFDLEDLDEDGFAAYETASERPEVNAAFDAALQAWADAVTYRMADELVDTHTLNLVHGVPHLDGEPLYQNRTPR